ncbi:enoyl-CoA hydratase/isomerase family protein [Virgibacillus byunsanensis]|uniref:Enoyl-CoA hydratase/isomerase family protein n=1 Tax=Virgibacillus byunsanensis TaxID=570945 RepID=A0ABW3LM48_9BACI
MELVKYQTHDKGYGILQLNRPDKRNAVSVEMVDALKNSLKEAKQSSVTFLVITGAGNDMFCAGGDLQDLHGSLTRDEAFQTLYPMKEVIYEIASFPVPTICLLNGDALGGGCEIATACDIRVAKDNTRFGFVQSKLGIIPGWGGGTLLYEKVHTNFALCWLLEAEVYDASFLMDRGWLHKVVTTEEFYDQDKLLKPYLSKSLEQMKILKSQYNKKLSMLGLSAQMDEEVRNCSLLWDSEEHIEALNQFYKRK